MPLPLKKEERAKKVQVSKVEKKPRKVVPTAKELARKKDTVLAKRRREQIMKNMRVAGEASGSESEETRCHFGLT